MVKKNYLKKFIHDEKAISEEFTSLPSLSVVMIGFTLFFVLLATVYTSYEVRVESLEKYQTADFIATKLSNPDCFFIKEGGMVDLPLMNTTDGKYDLSLLCEKYNLSGVNFTLRISWANMHKDFPDDLPDYVGDRVAVSKSVGVYLNEVQTVPGELTVIMWDTS